jgi:hypothetical protein
VIGKTNGALDIDIPFRLFENNDVKVVLQSNTFGHQQWTVTMEVGKLVPLARADCEGNCRVSFLNSIVLNETPRSTPIIVREAENIAELGYDLLFDVADGDPLRALTDIRDFAKEFITTLSGRPQTS